MRLEGYLSRAACCACLALFLLLSTVSFGLLVPQDISPNSQDQQTAEAPQADERSTASAMTIANPQAGEPTIEALPDSPDAVRPLMALQDQSSSTPAGSNQTTTPQPVQPSQQQTQTAPTSSQQPAPQPAQQQAQNATQEPSGTAAARSANPAGVAASEPAGSAIAPAKQRRVRTILISMAAILGAGAAIGVVAGLSAASPSRPPGAH
jgi:cytoskeletal protein RodZ